jgi:hypothetical protein
MEALTRTMVFWDDDTPGNDGDDDPGFNFLPNEEEDDNNNNDSKGDGSLPPPLLK